MIRRNGKTLPSQSALARKFLIALCAFLVSGVWLSGCGKKGATQKWSPHYSKAVEAYREGDYQKAVSLFRKALLYDSSKAELYLDIAAIYDDFLGDARGAISCYEEYLRLAGGGEMAAWVRRWMGKAKGRLAAAGGQEEPGGSESETAPNKDRLIETLREKLLASTQALAEEREKTTSLSEQVSSLYTRLSTAKKESEQLQSRVATHTRRWLPVNWILCLCLCVLVVALVIRQRHAGAKERALLAGIQAAAFGLTERIRKEDILGKYFWVENDRSAGILTFSEADGEIHVCAIDGTTHFRSRGKGKLVGNVLTGELRSGGEETVVTKFIFANKGRTLTAVWQGGEGTSVAAGTKAVGD